MPNIATFTLVVFFLANAVLLCCVLVDLPIHYFRGMGLWEKVSHPIDSFFIAASMGLGFLALKLHSANIFWFYCFIALITTILTYKDEVIHQQECPPIEQFIHAVMFTCIGVSLSTGAMMIILGIGKSLFLLGLGFGVFFFFTQLVLNLFTKAPKELATKQI